MKIAVAENPRRGSMGSEVSGGAGEVRAVDGDGLAGDALQKVVDVALTVVAG